MTATSATIQGFVQDQWVDALRKALSSMTQETFEISIAERSGSQGALHQEEKWSWYSQVLTLSPDSTVWAGATTESWAALSNSILTAPDLPGKGPKDIQSICADIIARSNRSLAQELTERFGTEIKCGDIVPTEQAPGSEFIVLSIAAGRLPRPVSIGVSFDEPIFKCLLRLSHDQRAELPSPPSVPSSISDLRLNLHATLGKTELLLDSVLKFNVGSVIDIGRSVTDLVDVVANGKVIARGQVVAFRGNYAIKIVATRSAAVMPPAVFQANTDSGSIGLGRTDERLQSGSSIGGYDA